MKFGEWLKDIRTYKRAAAVAAILILAVGWITVDTLLLPRDKEPPVIEIPNFDGIEVGDIVPAEWLHIDIEYRYDENTPAGVVFDQTPIGGSRRRLTEGEKCHITLVVSLGSESILLPSVSGRDVLDAATELRNLGLVVNTVMRVSPCAAGMVLESAPRAGESVPKGATVTLTVSQGEKQKTVEVPNLCGLTRADALIRLWLCQLNVGEVVEAPSSAPVGTVFRQSHAEGTIVLPGTKIAVYISKENE